jgi:hypothetical protein
LVVVEVAAAVVQRFGNNVLRVQSEGVGWSSVAKRFIIAFAVLEIKSW